MNLTNRGQHSILNALYLEAAENLLAAHGTHAHLVRQHGAGTSVPNTPSYVCVLGATGDGVALSSMLKIDRAVLISVHPLGSAEISQLDLEDWCRELNNQLVGRMKNKLLGYGVAIALSLPMLLSATDVTAIAGPDVTVNEHSFRSAAGQIALTLATFVDPQLELREREFSGEDDGALLEGAVSLF